MAHSDLSSRLCPTGFHLLHVFLAGDLHGKEFLYLINPHAVMELLEEGKTFFFVFLERIDEVEKLFTVQIARPGYTNEWPSECRALQSRHWRSHY